MSAVTEVKERGIIMTGDSVRAVMDGRKTQTRRVVKMEPWMTREPMVGMTLDTAWVDPGLGGGAYLKVPRKSDDTAHRLFCPYGSVGDRLWVRETWTIKNWTDKECAQMGYADAPQHPTEVYLGTPTRSVFREGWQAEWGSEQWCSPIHMPRWASRLTLEITGVRVERLQEISTHDIGAEGINLSNNHQGARNEYRQLWDALNAKRGCSWNSNPWIWVISFQPTAA